MVHRRCYLITLYSKTHIIIFPRKVNSNDVINIRDNDRQRTAHRQSFTEKDTETCETAIW